MKLFLDKTAQKTYAAELTKRADGAYEVAVKLALGAASSLPALTGECRYTFCPDGAVELRFAGRLKEIIPRLPLIGVELRLPKELDKARYYGCLLYTSRCV